MRVLAARMRQLELLPAHLIAIPCEYENGEVIKVTDGRRSCDHTVLIVNQESGGGDSLSVTDDASRIGIIWHPATEKQCVPRSRATAGHVAMLAVPPQHLEPDLLPLHYSYRSGAAGRGAHAGYRWRISREVKAWSGTAGEYRKINFAAESNVERHHVRAFF